MSMYHRLLSGMVAGAMAFSLAAPAAAANGPDGLDAPASKPMGSISATLRLDYAQKLSALEARNVTMTLKQGSKELSSVALGKGTSTGLQVEYSARNADGGDLGGSQWPGYLDVTISQLPQGDYTLEFTGEGYTTYTQKITLQDYSQAVVLGTGDATFGLGDVNGDNKVDGADREELSNHLGKQDQRYDLNGDQKIDIQDLAYVSRQCEAQGKAEVFDTVLLAPRVNTAKLTNSLTVTEGTAEDLFLDNGTSVTMKAQDGKLEIPIEFAEKTEMESIEIVTPQGLEKGTVTVVDSDGKDHVYSMDNTMPAEVYAIRTRDGQNSNVVTIDLGSRVAVKKVTVSVTEVNGDYVVVDQIRFLKDIVPENPVAPNRVVKSVHAIAGDGQVTLKWGELPNVTGYKVTYWMENGGETQEIRTESPTVVVSGLENLKTYTFTVTPTSSDWEGQPSAPVTATPQPAKAPDAPDMVRVKHGDGALHVSWKACKTATSYEVYYTDVEQADLGSYHRLDKVVTDTQVKIPNLINGRPYYIYVVAVNSLGKSAPSKIATGTPVAVEYKEPAGLPKDMVRISRDQVASITMTDPRNVSANGTENFTTDYLMDGNYKTNWTSQSYGDGSFGRSKEISYTFKEPVDLNSVIYVPRADGFENSMRLYGITVWCKGDDLSGSGKTLVTMNGRDKTPIRGKMGNDQDGYFLVLPFPATKDIVKIAVDLEQTDYGAVGVSEVIFFQYDESKDLDRKVDQLFADKAHTQLTKGVETEQIEALSQALVGNEGYYLDADTMKDELNLAAELANGQNSGVVLKGIDSRSSAVDVQNCGQGGSDFQPLGVTANAGQTVTIYAEGIPEGETVTLWATQYHAEASAWQANLGALENGRNVVTIPKIGDQTTPRGGSLYITYSGSNGDGITLHTRRATDIPVLELSDWASMNESARRAVIAQYVEELTAYTQKIPAAAKTSDPRNVTEISLPGVLLSIPATAVMDNTSRGGEADQCDVLYRNAEAWEQVMEIVKTTQGIEVAMTSRQNIRYMQMFAGAFMYAAGSHIGVEYGSCGGLVNGRPVDADGNGSLFGWGIAHEIGHNMDKLGKAEITNNIYPLMVQTFDGQNNVGTSRLETSDKYPEIFQKTALGHPGASNDVFVQLGMYWQLHLAYDGKLNDQQGPMDFYNRFFKAWKAGTAFQESDSYDDKVALTAAYVTRTDLTDFFTRWGMQLSAETQDTLSTYGEESRAIWYLSDESRRDRLNGEAAGAGTITANAQLQGEKEVVLTLGEQLTAGTLQGYEIRRNGIPVGFTREHTFTDIIGSANHMTFTYTVQAYDTLGNPIGKPVNAGDIRVAYDKVLDADAYTLTRTDDTVTVTMNQGAVPLSGIKLVNTGDLSRQGDYTITVTAKGKEVEAKAGSYQTNSSSDLDNYVTYFSKPNTNDSRIWTYDVEKLVMTNVPENVELQLIRYAEDDVAFTSGGAVGVLESDYHYGTGAEDVISAGTLVITGTYRGDPVYNTLRIKGDFTSTVMDENGEQETQRVERYLDGYALLLAEVPADGEVSDISDGIFIFVPNVQKEQELQGAESHCTVNNLLPTRMMVELYRSDDPNSADSLRPTASSSWIYSPGGDDLPTIVLKGADQ